MALNPKLKVEIFDLKGGANNWTDITTVTKQASGSYGMGAPQSPNPLPGTCTVILRNSSGLYTPGTNTIVEPGNLLRILAKSTLGKCLRVTHSGTTSASTFQQLTAATTTGGESIVLSWEARSQWSDKWNTDLTYVQISGTPYGSTNFAYTNRWRAYSITIPSAVAGSSIYGVWWTDLTRTQPYQYVEYRNMSLKINGVEKFTNRDFSNGTTGWSVTNVGAGTLSITAVDDTYPVFYGFIEEDPFVPLPQSDAETTLTVTDMLTRLSFSRMVAPLQRNKRADELVSIALEYIYENPKATWKALNRSKLPRRWYRFTETSGTTFADSGIDNLAGTWINSPTLGAAGLLSNGDTDPSAQFAGTTQYGSVPSLDISNKSWSVTALINSDSTGGAIQSIIGFYHATRWMNIWCYSTGLLGVGYPNLSGSPAYTDTFPAVPVTKNTLHFIAVTFEYPAGTLRFYVDGSLITTRTGMAAYTVSNPTIRIGDDGNGTNPFKGLLDEVELWDFQLSTSEITDLYNATLFDVELQKRWLPGYQIETGRQTFATSFDGYRSDTTTPADVLADSATSEAGRWYFDGDGTIHFRNRDWAILWRNRLGLYSGTLPDDYRTLTITPGVTPYVPLPHYSAGRVINRARVTYRPRTIVSGALTTVAQSTSTIIVPPLVRGSYGVSGSEPGEKIVTLSFRDSSNNPIGATDVVATLTPYNAASPSDPFDYRVVGDINDETLGTDYTPGGAHGQYFSYQFLQINASEVTIRFKNYAIGNLYITQLRIKGYAVTSFDPVTVESNDVTSRRQYGVRTFDKILPFSNDPNFAQSLADYYVQRFKDPFVEYDYQFSEVNSVGGVDLFSLQIGDVIQNSGGSNFHTIAGISFDLKPDSGTLLFLGNRADTPIFGAWGTDYTLWNTGGGAVWGI